MPVLFKHYKYVLALVLILIAFASGRYSAQKPTTQTQVAIKDTIQEHKNETIQAHTQTVATKAPDGTTKVVTTTDSVSTLKSEIKDQQDETVRQLVSSPKPQWTISALATYDFSDHTPRYGLHVTKEILGPVTGGLFLLSNGTLGVSIGVSF